MLLCFFFNVLFVCFKQRHTCKKTGKDLSELLQKEKGDKITGS